MEAARLEFVVPGLERMRGAKSCRDLWQRMNNDAVFRFEQFLVRALGVRARLIDESSAETFEACARLVEALDPAARLLGYLMPSRPSDWRTATRALKEWLERQPIPRSPRVEDAVLHAMVSDLALAAKQGKFEGDDFAERDVDRLFSVRIIRDDVPLPDQRFDVFVSYRHREYADLAESLTFALEERGIRTWLDSRELDLKADNRVSDAQLRRRLRGALEACDHTVFFETTDSLFAGEPDIRGSHVSFNWQVFEHRHARDLAYVRPPTHRVDFTGGSAGWSDVAELADVLAAHFNQVGAVPIAERPAEPPWEDAARELDAQAEAFFGGPVQVTQTAALALLTDDANPDDGFQDYRLGDAVLVALLRLEPGAALLFANAGLDAGLVFEVGARVQRRRWSCPRAHIFEDCFGGEEQPSCRPLSGVIGSRELLAALLRVGFRGYASGRLLDLAVRLRSPELSDTDRAAEVARICEELTTRLNAEHDCLGTTGRLVLDDVTRSVTILGHVLNPQSARFEGAAELDGSPLAGFAVDMGGPMLFCAEETEPHALDFPDGDRRWQPAVLHTTAQPAAFPTGSALLDTVTDLLPLMAYNAARDLDYDEW